MNSGPVEYYWQSNNIILVKIICPFGLSVLLDIVPRPSESQCPSPTKRLLLRFDKKISEWSTILIIVIMANKTTIVGSSPIPPSSYPPPHVHVASGTAIAKSIFLVAIVIKIFSSGDLFRNSHPDPRTVAHRGRYDDDGPLLAIPASRLDELKYREPTVNYHRRSDSSSVRRGTVLDVLSIGSMTRIEYVSTTTSTHSRTIYIIHPFAFNKQSFQLTAQVNTWASHVDVRNFWGFTERDDYDPNCAIAMGDRSALASFVKTCRSPTLWHHRADAGGEGGGGQGTKSDRMFDRMFKNFERLRVKTYGLSSWNDTNGHNSGWYCAQRRHGRALGWLRAAYQNSTTMPDFLLIVDDDTSLVRDFVLIEYLHAFMSTMNYDDSIDFLKLYSTVITITPALFRI